LTVVAPPATGPPAPAPQPASPQPQLQVAGTNVQAGGVTLVDATLSVPSQGTAASVTLHCTAPGGCAGKLSLTASKSKHGKQHASRPVTLASGSFAIAAGRTMTVKLKLNAAARGLLRSGGGRLVAHLTIVEVASGERQTRSEAVDVVEQKASRSGAKKR
jgi:hypothetical protein